MDLKQIENVVYYHRVTPGMAENNGYKDQKGKKHKEYWILNHKDLLSYHVYQFCYFYESFVV